MTGNNDSRAILRKIIEEKVDITLKQSISNLLRENPTNNSQELLQKLELKCIEDEICNEYEKAQDSKQITWSDYNFDYCDYNLIIEHLNSNSTIGKLKALDELLNIPVIDTKQQRWPELALCFQKCFVCANHEIFMKILRVHYKMILFSNTTFDGFLSLLKGALTLLNSKYFGDATRNRLPQILKMILGLTRNLIQQLLHYNNRQIAEIISTFVKVISHNKSILRFMEVFDKKSKWLEYFCYGAYIRNNFFAALMSTNVIRTIFNDFVKYLKYQSSNYYGGFIILNFLSYNSNQEYFPLQINENHTISFPHILELLIIRATREKSNDLIEILIKLSENSVKFHTKALNLLLDFRELNSEDIRNFVHNNSFIFKIVGNIAKSKHFGMLFGNCAKFRRSKSRIILKNSQNYPQKIVDTATIFFENPNLNDLSTVLDCCKQIYYCHSVAFYYINSENLILALSNLYRITLNFDDKIEILNLLNYFYSKYSLMIKIIGCDDQILTDIFTFNRSIKLVIMAIAENPIGYEFLKNSAQSIIKSYLESIWSFDEKSDGYLALVQQNNPTIVEFLFFIYTIQFNYKAVMAFLSDDNEKTIVESNDYTLQLNELIEKCLCITTKSNNFLEEFLALLIVKVLIQNSDLMVFLEANYQIQEKLATIQESAITYNNKIIVDELTSLRHNVIISLSSIGTPKPQLNNNILEQTELIHCNLEFEPTSNENELVNYLGGKVQDINWILQARRHFKSSLKLANFSSINRLLEHIPKTHVYRKMELNWPPDDSVYYQLYPEDFVGITTIIRYGRQAKYLDCEDHAEQLTLLIKQSRALLNHQPEEFNNFDWFVGVIYLINYGVLECCKTTLINFVDTYVVSLVWRTFGKEFDHSIQENFYQQLSMILEDNCQCYKALQILEISPEHLVRSWLSQCFFNILSFGEISKFLEFVILYPPESLLYYMVSIFKYLDEKICVNTISKSVDTMLQMCDLSEFHLDDHIDYIEKLMRQYRNTHKLC